MTAAIYTHTERAGWWIAILIMALLTGGLMFFVFSRPRTGADGASGVLWLLLSGPIVLLITALEARAMTISVDDERLAWRFGLGLFWKSVPVDDVAAVDVVKPSAWAGVGIHYTGRDGWLYNVNWGPAVRFTLRDGKKFMLGTDDPSGVIAAVRSVNPMIPPLER